MQLSSNKTGLILLTLIVAVSGCADNSESDVTVSQTEGVSIEGFSSSPSEIFEGQLTTLELQLKNAGGTQAEDVVARLFNRGFEGEGTWNIQATGSSGVEEAKNVYFGDLSGPDPQTDAPAISVPRTWNLEAPDLDVAQQVPYEFNTRVFYKYDTTANTDIQIMSNDRYNELGTSRSQPDIDNSGGPIQIDVKTRTPVVFTSTGQDTQPVPIRVVVTNEGSGTPFLQSAYTGDESYDVSNDDSGRIDLEIKAAGNSVSFDSNEQTVRLVNGEGVKSFTMNVDRVSNQDIQQTVPLTVTANYGYYQDTSTSVTVNGREDQVNPDEAGEDTVDDTSSEYTWTGSDDQKESQMNNYDVDTVDALCQNLIEDDSLAAENCEEN